MEEQAFWSWFCQTGEPLAYLLQSRLRTCFTAGQRAETAVRPDFRGQGPRT